MNDQALVAALGALGLAIVMVAGRWTVRLSRGSFRVVNEVRVAAGLSLVVMLVVGSAILGKTWFSLLTSGGLVAGGLWLRRLGGNGLILGFKPRLLGNLVAIVGLMGVLIAVVEVVAT